MAIVDGISTYIETNKFGGTTMEINVLAPYFRILIHSTIDEDYVTDVKRVGFLKYKTFNSFVSKGNVEEIISIAYTRIWEYVNFKPQQIQSLVAN